jgi:hypothetical protein
MQRKHVILLFGVRYVSLMPEEMMMMICYKACNFCKIWENEKIQNINKIWSNLE